MAVKDLVFRILGEDSVSPVFKRIATEAKVSAGEVSAAYKEAGASVDKSMGAASASGASGFSKIGKAATAGSLVVVGAAALIGVKAVHMAADFQTSITRLSTSAGEAKKNLGMVSQGILDMASKTSTSAQDLAKGMYTVESAGYHGAAALDVLKKSAQGAATEGADLTSVTNAVTTAMTDYGLKGAHGAAVATNTLLAAVSRGKTTFDQLASAMPTVLPAAAAVHISLQEVAAGMATMTAQGTPAAKAATYLRSTFMALATGGTAQAQGALHDLGLNANNVSLELGKKGLAATITTITDALQKHLTPAGLEALKTFKQSGGTMADYKKMLDKSSGSMQTTYGMLTKMFGGVKGLQGVLELSGPHMKTFKANTDAISKAVDEGGNHIEGFSEYQKTFNAQVEEAKVSIEALAIGIGLDLLPWVSKITEKIAEATRFLGEHKSEVEIVGLAILGLATSILVVEGALKAWSLATKIWTDVTKVATGVQWLFNAAMDANPIVLVVIGLAALAVGFYEAYKHCQTFRDIVNAAWADIKAATQDVVHFAIGLWDRFGGTIISGAKGMLSGVISIFKGGFQIVMGVFHLFYDLLTGNWSKLWGDVKQILSGAWSVIKGLVRIGIAAVGTALQVGWGIIGGDVRSAWRSIQGWVSSGVSTVVGAVASIPGKIKALGGAILSAGESLISQLFHGIEQAAANIGGFVGNLAATIASAIKNEINSVLHLPLVVSFHHFGINFDQTVIPALAEGGLVTRPTLALVGEAGPEAVIPLNRFKVGPGDDREGEGARHRHAPASRPTVNIEHYYEAGLTPAQVAMDLLFLAA